MLFLAQTGMYSYSRMGDVGVIALCIVVFILLNTSRVSRTRSYRIFCGIVGLLMLAAVVNIGFHEILVRRIEHTRGLLYSLRLVYKGLLFNVFFLFSLYVTVVSNLEHKKARIIAFVSTGLFILIFAIDIILTFAGVGFKIGEDGSILSVSYVFTIGYLVYVAFLGFLMLLVRKLLYKRVVLGFYAVVALAVFIRLGQLVINEASLITFTFVPPVITMLYVMHSNPYNISLGTLDIRAMEDYVTELHSHRKPFIFMSLLLPDFRGEGKELPDGIKEQTRRFSAELFRNGLLFQPNNGQIIMIAKKDSNPDYEQWIQKILEAFKEQEQVFKLPFKIVYGESIAEISEKNAYVSLIDTIHENIPDCTIHRVCEFDIQRFRTRDYIFHELEDIYRKKDLNDPRVLVYCQPVFNIQTKSFDTAEALMRLELEKTGMVYPDQFIEIAEDHGFIHVLTQIIMNKTCQAILEFEEEGLEIERISVNVSALELKDSRFCDDVTEIINNNGIDGSKLAIELTESNTEEDFVIMKDKIEKLRKQGIQFYLDDFGTGYSNMERILELPFDIIKFDRSMVIASGINERSEQIIQTLANMFSNLKYSVLYEGVEDSEDENRCLGMAASYLQGFKYSKPIPISQLRVFIAR